MSSRPQYAFNDGNDMQEYFAPSGGPPKAGEFQSLYTGRTPSATT